MLSKKSLFVSVLALDVLVILSRLRLL